MIFESAPSSDERAAQNAHLPKVPSSSLYRSFAQNVFVGSRFLQPSV
jgi:hypothetical protein